MSELQTCQQPTDRCSTCGLHKGDWTNRPHRLRDSENPTNHPFTPTPCGKPLVMSHVRDETGGGERTVEIEWRCPIHGEEVR